MSRVLPALAAFLIAVAALLPSALTLPMAGDESQYLWTSHYYGTRLASLNFDTREVDQWVDPGWNPFNQWALTQPMGTRMIYALGQMLTGAKAPNRPYLPDYEEFHGPDTEVPAADLHTIRLFAVACAALGFALLASRLGWRGVLIALLMLAIPNVRDDLARAWAEGPLLLGLGVCAVTFGRGWFGPACSLAATFKLTALALWPLVIWYGPMGRGRFRHVLGVVATPLIWSALTPPSWFSVGPFYVLFMLTDRLKEHMLQSQAQFYFPSRYAWPLELLAVMGLVLAAAQLRRRIAKAQPSGVDRCA